MIVSKKGGGFYMAVSDLFKVSWKTFFNPRAWLGYDELKSQHSLVMTALKNIFARPQASHQETFEQALERFELSEADLEAKIKTCVLFAMCFTFCGVVLFSYTCYLLFGYRSLLASGLGVSATALFLAQAFKYDFWVMQMKARRLGMTYHDWWRRWFEPSGQKK